MREAEAEASYVAGSPYPSRSPRPTGAAGLGRRAESRDSHAPSFGTTPVGMWNWPLAPLYDKPEIKW